MDERRKIISKLGPIGRSAIEALPNPEKEFKKSIQKTRTLLGISIEEQAKFPNSSVGHISKSELAKIRNSIRKHLEEEKLKNQEKTFRGGNTHIRDLGKKYPKIVLDALHKDQITLADAAYYLNSKVKTLQKIEARL